MTSAHPNTRRNTLIDMALPILVVTLIATLIVSALTIRLWTPEATVSQTAHQYGGPAERVKLRSFAENRAWVAGETNWIALVFDIERDWYIYWRNPGGGSSTFWELATDVSGVSLGDALWPTPEFKPSPIETSDDADYIYHKRAVVLIPVEIDASLARNKGQTLKVELNVEWLVCKDSCIPGSGSVAIEMPITDDAGEAENARNTRFFEKQRSEMPTLLETEDDMASKGVSASWEGKTLVIAVSGATELTFFPFENDQRIGVDKPKKMSRKNADTLEIEFNSDPAVLKEIAAVLVVAQGDDEHAYEIHVPTEQ